MKKGRKTNFSNKKKKILQFYLETIVKMIHLHLNLSSSSKDHRAQHKQKIRTLRTNAPFPKLLGIGKIKGGSF